MVKISYNDDYKKEIVNNLNTCINILGEANNILYNTNIPYNYYYTNNLKEIKNSLINSKNELDEYKIQINKYITNIEKNELELFSNISNLEEIIIEKF